MGVSIAMKKVWIPSILSILCLICSATVVLGKQVMADELSYVVFDQSYERLKAIDMQAKDLYEFGNYNHKQAMYHSIQKLKQLLKDDQIKRYGTSKGWQQIEEDVITMEKALVKGSLRIQWQEPLNRIMLAIDSLMQTEHGPWLQYEALLLDDLRQVKQATKRLAGDRSEAASGMLSMMKLRVERMQPAAYMVGDEFRMNELKERMDQLSAFFSETIGVKWTSKQEELLQRSISGLELTIHEVFKQSEQTMIIPIGMERTNVAAINMALLLGAFISSLLAFAGWRKYKQNPYGIKPIE